MEIFYVTCKLCEIVIVGRILFIWKNEDKVQKPIGTCRVMFLSLNFFTLNVKSLCAYKHQC